MWVIQAKFTRKFISVQVTGHIDTILEDNKDLTNMISNQGCRLSDAPLLSFMGGYASWHEAC